MRISKAISYGHAVQSFSNAIYGFSTAVIANVFFDSSDSDFLRLLSSYGSYAAGYIAFPIGAVIFGIFGDRYGRKPMILISTLCTGIVITLIGCIPSYNSIGMLAPIVLMMLRIIQGFCGGAEYSGVFVYNYENLNDKGKIGSSTAWLLSCGIVGACFAILIMYAVTFNSEYVPKWGWRLPFIIAGLATIISFISRLTINETTEYSSEKNSKNIIFNPYKKLIKNHKINILIGIFLSAYGLMSYCLAIVYGNNLLQKCGLSVHESMLYCLPIMIYFAAAILYSGKLADIIGVKRQNIIGLVAMVLTVPYMCYVVSGDNLTIKNVCIYIILMISVSALSTSCFNAMIAKSFPINVRYSGVSICDAFGSLIGSCTLFIVLFLSEYFCTKMAIVLWVYFVIFPILIGFWLQHKQKKL